MKKKTKTHPTHRKFEVGPDWNERAVFVVQNARADGLLGYCEVSIDDMDFLTIEDTHEVILAIKSAQTQAATWNQDAGKMALDVFAKNCIVPVAK